ncbi:MAG: hypothetical protein ACYS8K_06700 [Planctomycetota bacterium]|jgi:hypothetical protein
MVVTKKKRVANRANARKSTGPRSAGGKAKSSRNALKHGLRSQSVLAPWENAAEYEAFSAELLAQLAPRNALERLLATKVVVEAWRLRRASRCEAEILDQERRRMAGDRRDWPRDYQHDPPLTLGQLVRKLIESGVLPLLSRYEVRIERSLYKALHEFQRLQAAGRGEPVPAPVAVDVDVHVAGEAPAGPLAPGDAAALARPCEAPEDNESDGPPQT